MAQDQSKSSKNRLPSEAETRSEYRACFTSPAGRAVLEDLKSNFYDCRIGKDQLERQVGHRDVILAILERLRND